MALKRNQTFFELLTRLSSLAIDRISGIPEDELDPYEADVQKKRSILRKGASEEELVVLISRSPWPLPDDLLALLKISNGFIIPVMDTGPAKFYGCCEIGRFDAREPELFEEWMNLAPDFCGEPSGEADALSRGELQSAFALSEVSGGTILLMRPSPGSDGCYEFVRLSVHVASRRYSSLYEMIDALIADVVEALQSDRQFR